MTQQNIRYMSRIKSALEHHQRPTAALLELPDPNAGWTSHDYRIQEAVSILDKEICKTCSNPVWLCHSTDNRIDFEVRIGTCYAQAELKDYEENKSNADLNNGEYPYAVAVGVENEDGSRDPLPSRREAMMTVN